jgi:hypothetical protein
MKGICKDEQTMMKEDRKSGERYEKRWKKVENRNITPLYPSRIPDLTFGAKANR